IEAPGAARQTPARKKTFAALERAVNIRKKICEQLVVIAKFQQLRVRVFKQIKNRGSGVGLVVDERGGPAHHDQVGGIVGERAAKNFVAFRGGERSDFTADQLGDLVAIVLKE